MDGIYPVEPILSRVSPEQASARDVACAIRSILEWNWESGYTYAHVVIDDYNLSDYFILKCLLRRSTVPSRIVDFAVFLVLDREVTRLLRWLLRTNEHVRDDAEELLRGSSETEYTWRSITRL